MREIMYNDEKYMLDEVSKTVSDEFGNTITYIADSIPEQHLAWYIHMLFMEIHKDVNAFNKSINTKFANNYAVWDRKIG